MALGIDFEGGGGGDIVNFVKFNAKAGRMMRRDRENGENVEVDITRNFKAVMDIENIETGWINFDTGGAPSVIMSRWDEPKPDKPNDKHRMGVRVLMKLSKECGGDIREMTSHAKSFLRGMNPLHDEFLREFGNNPGKVPVVVLVDTTPITTGEGAKRSTNYAPVFQITGWVKRPDDLVYKPRGAKAAAPEPEFKAPPSTGSSRAAPPSKPAPADDDDFG